MTGFCMHHFNDMSEQPLCGSHEKWLPIGFESVEQTVVLLTLQNKVKDAPFLGALCQPADPKSMSRKRMAKRAKQNYRMGHP